MNSANTNRIKVLREQLIALLHEDYEKPSPIAQELASILPPVTDDQLQAALSDLSLAIDIKWLLHAWTVTNEGLGEFSECDRLDANYLKLALHWVEDCHQSVGEDSKYARNEIEDLLDLLELQGARRLEIGNLDGAHESISDMQSLAERNGFELDEGQRHLIERILGER